jgi:hypothetical protein
MGWDGIGWDDVNEMTLDESNDLISSMASPNSMMHDDDDDDDDDEANKE